MSAPASVPEPKAAATAADTDTHAARTGPAAPAHRLGEVITFYSYKGGTGRSMLLANVAWQLASAGQRVLVMDWDLEAPGLHRYFKPFLGADPELREQPGVMQWLTDYWDACLDEPDLPVERLVREYADPRSYVLSLDLKGYASGAIDLMGAGRQDSRYAASVADFDFTNLYQRLHGEDFIDTAKKILTNRDEGYDYVLVDSRTGVSDTSGFCTVALADTLVVCFTYNNQSVIGAGQIARDIKQQAEARRAQQVQQGQARRFRLFAVPSRVDEMAVERLELRQKHAWSLFGELLTDVSKEQQHPYWDSVQIRNSGHFAYEEVLAVCMNRPTDPQTVLGSVNQLVRWLCDDVVPPPAPLGDHERAELRALFAAQSTSTATSGSTSTGLAPRPSAWARFVAEQADPAARDALLQACFPLLCQLFAPAPMGTTAAPAPAAVRCRLLEAELTVEERRMADTLTAASLVQRHVTDDQQRAIELIDDSVLPAWSGLRSLMEKHADFVAAREDIRHARRSWDVGGRSMAGLRGLQGAFARTEFDDQQRAWLGRPNLQFLMAVKELQAQETQQQALLAAAEEREGALKAQLQSVEADLQGLKTFARQMEEAARGQANELRHESVRASAQTVRLKVSAVATAVLLGGLAWGGYYTADKNSRRLQELQMQSAAAVQKAEDLTVRLAAAEKARALDAAARFIQAGMEADDLSRRKRGEEREQAIRSAVDFYTRAIDADPRAADAYRARAQSLARFQVRDINRELEDWALYYDLRRSVSGRTQLIARALIEPVANVGFIDSQLSKLLDDVAADKESELSPLQVADRLEQALKSATPAVRSHVLPTVDKLVAMAGGVPTKSRMPEPSKKTSTPTPGIPKLSQQTQQPQQQQPSQQQPQPQQQQQQQQQPSQRDIPLPAAASPQPVNTARPAPAAVRSSVSKSPDVLQRAPP